ncbi:MAG: hypothetical protein ACKODX_01335 [Gemmata sp.]
MRIDPTGIPATSSKPVASASRASAKGPDAAAATATESFALSGDLASLLALVRQAPEVRTEVIEQAAANLAAGVFDTPEAAAGAAQALLDTDDTAPPG